MVKIATLVLTALLLSGIYLCVRFARMLRHNFPNMRKPAVWFFSVTTVAVMTLFWSAWGLFVYLVLALAAGDLTGVALSRFARAKNVWEKFWRGGATGAAIALAVLAFGWRNAMNIRETRHEIFIPKSAGEIKKFRAVLLTDMHLGMTIRARQLDALAARINALAPDVVFLGGDTYDKHHPELAERSFATWQSLNARHGVICIGGNHERARYAGPGMAVVFARLRETGVRVLEDETLLLDGAIYVVGRKDRSIERLSAAELTRPLDKSKPVILLDHQPVGMAEAAAAGVDLKLSGHTHAGQIWPFGLAVRYISENEMVYGHKRFGTMQAVTSSGIGNWAFPVRIGTKSEIVVLDIRFGAED